MTNWYFFLLFQSFHSILEEDQLFPTAISVGLILNNPGELNITGALGPGQIANIALRNDTAERILAMAAPRNGFDPSTLDLSSVTELFYAEGVREEVGWIPVEQDLEKIYSNTQTSCLVLWEFI